MAAGTKISLALAALLALVLVVYYGVMSGGEAADSVARDLTAPASAQAAERAEREEQRERPERQQRQPQRQPPPRQTPLPQPPASDGRFLRESLDRARGREPTPVEVPARDKPEEPPAPQEASSAAEPSQESPDEEAGPGAEAADDDATTERTAGTDPEKGPDPRRPRTTDDGADESDDPRPQPTPPQPPEYVEHAVRSGQTMSSIASDWFGDASKWDLIAKANPLVDPNRLRVGQVLRLPPKDAGRKEPGERPGSGEVRYVVRSGDTLSRIAIQYYGRSELWRIIYDANREAIGGDPHALRVGMRLSIPPAPKPAEDG